MGRIKLEIIAGKATMTPPIGPILGQYGIPGQKFCNDFNELTKNYKIGIPLRVILYLLPNTPKTSLLAMRAVIKPNRIKLVKDLIDNNGYLALEDLYKLALILEKTEKGNLKEISKNLIAIGESMKSKIRIRKEDPK